MDWIKYAYWLAVHVFEEESNELLVLNTNDIMENAVVLTVRNVLNTASKTNSSGRDLMKDLNRY